MTKDPTYKNSTSRPLPRVGQIGHVHIAKNGMLNCADPEGNDLPQFGGPSEEVLPGILRVYSGPVSREE